MTVLDILIKYGEAYQKDMANQGNSLFEGHCPIQEPVIPIALKSSFPFDTTCPHCGVGMAFSYQRPFGRNYVKQRFVCVTCKNPARKGVVFYRDIRKKIWDIMWSDGSVT